MVDELVPDEKLGPRHPYLVALALIIFLESAVLVAALGYLIFELGSGEPQSYPSAIALTVLTAIAAIWVALIGINVLRRQPWIRGAAVVWQVLQISVAIGSFQGVFSRPDIGWLLLIPAIAVLALLFTKPVLLQTARSEGM
ncbi:hypothetical protein FB472_2460 [Rhodoglobus vestalii]|uniref:Uncharacterized protein n=1 Tax=Rhodoglobus vestalii TaxID=193384 RepID=A0A8H2K8H3_9MICO|nr:hypothetical protein [Rhodoglobus vestalii]TQO20808.1 hypothetical protein FB472_2460 [Rhodoglobus vestalii]